MFSQGQQNNAFYCQPQITSDNLQKYKLETSLFKIRVENDQEMHRNSLEIL